MVIYLRHPDHGTKVACAESEAVYDEQHGWVRYDLDEPPVAANEMRRPRGRPRVELGA